MRNKLRLATWIVCLLAIMVSFACVITAANNIVENNLNIAFSSFLKQSLEEYDNNLYEKMFVDKNKHIRKYCYCLKMKPIKRESGKTVLEKPENIREISNLVSIACGKEMQIKYITQNNQVHQMTQEENLQNLANQSDIPFNVIE